MKVQICSCLLYHSSYRVSEDMPLYDILNEFQKGHSHIAVVYKDLNEKKEAELFKDNCKKPRGQPEKSSQRGEMEAATFFLNGFLITISCASGWSCKIPILKLIAYVLSQTST